MSVVDQVPHARERFVYDSQAIQGAIGEARAKNESPIVLLDHADNCGSGGTQDVMAVIAAVLDAGLDDVIVAAVWDPEAVKEMQAAGVGATVTLPLGGKTNRKLSVLRSR